MGKLDEFEEQYKNEGYETHRRNLGLADNALEIHKRNSHVSIKQETQSEFLIGLRVNRQAGPFDKKEEVHISKLKYKIPEFVEKLNAL